MRYFYIITSEVGSSRGPASSEKAAVMAAENDARSRGISVRLNLMESRDDDLVLIGQYKIHPDGRKDELEPLPGQVARRH